METSVKQTGNGQDGNDYSPIATLERAAPEHLEILLRTSRVGRVAGSVKVAAWRVQ